MKEITVIVDVRKKTPVLCIMFQQVKYIKKLVSLTRSSGFTKSYATL